MRSAFKLINVLVAAALLVTPLTLASAQSGNDGYDAYYNFAAGGAAEPIVLPWMGESSGTLDNVFADSSADLWKGDLAPGLLPVTGAESVYRPQSPFLWDIAALPVALPVTGASFDEASALRDAYGDLRATWRLRSSP